MKKRVFASVLALVMALCSFAIPAFQEPAEVHAETDKPAKRTVLLYCLGADLESKSGMASFNLEQILSSSFSSDDDINVIVMTGGSKMWQLDDDDEFDNDNNYLVFPDDVSVPEDAVNVSIPGTGVVVPIKNTKAAISGVYNQVWEARGKDAVDENGNKDPNAGKLVCLDGDGLTGAVGTAVKNEDELMSDPATLKAFINYGVANYPADKYDLIFWDHGGGPQGGYGYDENYNPEKKYPEGLSSGMSFAGIVDALSDNKVVDSDGDGMQDGKFDFVDFDACLMGNLELAMVLADYTKYYIGSAETEPGYGQYYGPKDGKYTGWLDELGRSDMDETYNAEDGSYALGKVIVDDIYEFYSDEESKGRGQNATLAVFDTGKMISNKEFIGALTELTGKLNSQANGTEGSPLTFYDELRSFFKSINYSDSQLYDLADAVAFLGVDDPERTDPADTDYTNEYTELAKKFADIFSHGETLNTVDNDFMYAKCTLDEKTEESYHYDKNKEGSQQYGSLFSTGLTVFFPDTKASTGSLQYFDAMDPVLAGMPVKDDGRYEFLKGYEEVVANYASILYTGISVDKILTNEHTYYPENNPYLNDKSKVDHEVVLKYWRDENDNFWNNIVSVYLSKRSAGVDGSLPWIERLVRQMVDDAILPSGIDGTEIKHEGKPGYRVEVKQGSDTIFESVEQNIVAELPALNAYLDSLSAKNKQRALRYGKFSVGSIGGIHQSDNTWEIEPFNNKWYAIKDGEGKYHAASIYRISNNKIGVPALYGTSEDGKDAERLVMMEFSDEEAAGAADSHELLSIYFFKTDVGPKRLDPSTLTGKFTLMPILYIPNAGGNRKFYLPLSMNTFVVDKDNASKITFDLTDIDNIPDIEDTDADGKKVNNTFTVTNLYGNKIDITERLVKTLKHISLANVSPAVYTGKELAPKVTYDGKTLEEGKDYTWEKVPDVIGEGEDEKYVTPKFISVRDYEVILTGKGEYTGFSIKPFSIQKAANPLKVKGRTVKASYKSLRKKSKTLTASKVLNYSSKGKGTRKFTKLSSGKKYKKITVNKKNGSLTLKKGLKKGTYKLKVKVTAAGTTNYKSGTMKVTITIKVK